MKVDKAQILAVQGELAQRFDYYLGIFAFNLLKKILRLLPLRLLLGLGSLLGRFAGLFCGRELSFCLSQLRFAFPDRADQARQIAHGVFSHFGESLAELLVLDRLLAKTATGPVSSSSHSAYKYITVEGDEILDWLKSSGSAALIMTTHLGPFELLAGYTVSRGIDVSTFARASRSPLIAKIVSDVHASIRLKTIWRDDRQAAANILRVFKRGGAIAALIDQDTNLLNTFSPIFGLKAAFPSATIKIAIKYGFPIINSQCLRRSRLKYSIKYERIDFEGFLARYDLEQASILPAGADTKAPETPAEEVAPQTDPTAEELSAKRLEARKGAQLAAERRLNAAVQYVVDTYAAQFEHYMRSYPEQWYWWHRRWRRRPGVDYNAHPELLRSSTEYLIWLDRKSEQKLRGDEIDVD